MDTDGLDIVLFSLTQDFQEAKVAATTGLNSVRSTTARLDVLESRVKALKEHFPSLELSPLVPSSSPERIETAQSIVPRHDWTAIRKEAEVRLRNRGIHLESVALDALLDKDEVTRIERRFRGGFGLSTHLDRYDVAAAATAGLAAALVDFFIVKIPKSIQYLGHHLQEGSPLTTWLHSLSVPDDNWLARHFKTSYDLVREVASEIPGFNPRTHRLQTFGHDPLIGLVIGTIDIIRGGLTAIARNGKIISIPNTGTAYNPFLALVWQIMHLLSDGFTKMGIPPPGWSLLQVFQIGSFGERERTVADLARFMYLKGYDNRHFLTMSTSVAAVEVVLRAYFWIRQKLDEDYNADITHTAGVAGAKGTGDHPRFQGMALAAHAVAAAANAGKVAVYAGNPLAINYVQWLRFFHATFVWMRTNLRSPSDVLIGHALANSKELEAGWSALRVTDPSFPTLVVR